MKLFLLTNPLYLYQKRLVEMNTSGCMEPCAGELLMMLFIIIGPWALLGMIGFVVGSCIDRALLMKKAQGGE